MDDEERERIRCALANAAAGAATARQALLPLGPIVERGVPVAGEQRGGLMAGMSIPQVIVSQTVARLATQAKVARTLLPDVPSRPVDTDTFVPTPEQFTVQADMLGDEYLSCPACTWQDMWEVRIGTDDGPANDLGSLMAAAREHIADKHGGQG